jgi:hypothetical protein
MRALKFYPYSNKSCKSVNHLCELVYASSTTIGKKKRTASTAIAGVLTSIAAYVSFFLFLIGMVGFLFDVNYEWLFVGAFSFLGFAFGLTGGILMLMRKHFLLSVIGMISLVVSGFVAILQYVVNGGNAAIALGLPIFVLAILSIVFVAVSKGEFT